MPRVRALRAYQTGAAGRPSTPTGQRCGFPPPWPAGLLALISCTEGRRALPPPLGGWRRCCCLLRCCYHHHYRCAALHAAGPRQVLRVAGVGLARCAWVSSSGVGQTHPGMSITLVPCRRLERSLCLDTDTCTVRAPQQRRRIRKMREGRRAAAAPKPGCSGSTAAANPNALRLCKQRLPALLLLVASLPVFFLPSTAPLPRTVATALKRYRKRGIWRMMLATPPARRCGAERTRRAEQRTLRRSARNVGWLPLQSVVLLHASEMIVAQPAAAAAPAAGGGG